MYAFVIGLENYRGGAGGLKKVDYAHNDARAFAQVLSEIYPPDRSTIEVFLDDQATRSDIQYLLSGRIAGLGPKDLFIFYYAGHGYHGAGGNRISAWDSHEHHVDETTLLLNEILVEPLAASACNQALAFIDACASHFKPTVSSRDVLSDLDVKEFDAFLRSAEYAAVYLSCSPGQKSFPSDEFRHGVWTYFLLRALRGEEKRALRNRALTDGSLRDYLKDAVPAYLTARTEVRSNQIPQARIEAGNSFLIRHVPVVPKPAPPSRDMSRAGVRSSRQYFESLSSGEVRSLPGFVKGAHYASKVASSAAENFAKGLLAQTIEDELQEIYEEVKDTFGYRARQISVAAANAKAMSTRRPSAIGSRPA